MPRQTNLQVRRDTAANWTTTNPTLASGEIGFETDTLEFKIGNGSTAWTSLKYSTDVSLLNGTITSATFAGLISDETGSGNVVFSTSPALTTPNIGAATGTSLNVSGQLFSNTAGQGSITLGDAAITKQSGSAFQFGSGGTFTQVVSAPTYTSTIAIGTAPFTVTSTTKVTNLNADTVDGFDTSVANAANTIVVRSSGGDINGNVITAVRYISNVVTGTAPFTVSSTTQVANLNAATTSISVNIGAGAAGSLPYQSAANTTTFLARTATNNSTLAFNSSTNAPFWVAPTLSNTYYAATTSAQLAGVISDETGSGALVFGTTPTITPANAVVATSATQAGYIGMPQNSQSGAYTLAAGDAGKHIYYTVTGQTVTIPNNTTVAFQIGTAVTFITANSVSLSIAITTDTLRLANTTNTGTRTLAANGVATAIKVTSNVWIISGNGLT
jgi:hypothetical protein